MPTDDQPSSPEGIQKEFKLKTPVASSLIKEVHRGASLRDREKTEALIRGLILKGLAPAAIKEKLGRKCVFVDETLIQRVYDGLGMTTDDQIKNLIEKKIAQKNVSLMDGSTQEKFKKRILSFLRARGHDPKTADLLIGDSLRRSRNSPHPL